MTKDLSHFFDIHHIIPVEIFNITDIREGLEKIFGPSYLDLRDTESNKIALYKNAFHPASSE